MHSAAPQRVPSEISSTGAIHGDQRHLKALQKREQCRQGIDSNEDDGDMNGEQERYLFVFQYRQ